MATNSSILAWKIPLTEKPGYSPWGCKESDFLLIEWTWLFLLWLCFLTYLLTLFGHPFFLYVTLYFITTQKYSTNSESKGLWYHISNLCHKLCLNYLTLVFVFFGTGCWRLEIHSPGSWSDVSVDFSSGFSCWISWAFCSCYL